MAASDTNTIGIDLGTSNSAAAVLRDGHPVLIPSSEGVSIGGKAFPSYVAVTPDGQTLIGEPARRQASDNPEGTATGFKRKMGRRVKVHLRDRSFTPEQLSALLLQKIKRDAEAFLGEPVQRAVVTVPAYFDDNQRNATKDAARVAGLEVIRLVNEPTAAALAYGLGRSDQELSVAVIDFGGGTLDVTRMHLGGGVFEVKATSGDTQLGGADMNRRLYEALAARFEVTSGIDVRADPQGSARLLEAAELAKIALTSHPTTRIHIPFIGAVRGQPQHFDLELTRAELERIVHPILERCRGPVERALTDANASDVDRILFVGGPTRMPAVRSFFEDVLGRKAVTSIDPMSCVAVGAAIQAAVLTGRVRDVVLVDVTPLTLGVETLGGVATPLIHRNTPVPVRRKEVFTTARDMQTSVTVHVYQGERPMSRDNTSLGELHLEGLAPAPRGVPKIEVVFDIDASGILGVTARDVATDKEQRISISGSTRLADEEKGRMIDEASRHAEEDLRRRRDADTLNEADAIGYQGERFLRDFADRVSREHRTSIEGNLLRVKAAVAEHDAAAAAKHLEELKTVLQRAGGGIYAEAGNVAEGAHTSPRPESWPTVPPIGRPSDPE